MCFVKKEYKVFQRFHKYKGFFDRLFLITKDKILAKRLAEDLTNKGISEDGRIDYEGIVE